MRARGIESGGDSSDDDRPRYHLFIQVLCRSRGRMINVYVFSFVRRIKIEGGGSIFIYFFRFVGSRRGEGSISVYFLGLEDQGGKDLNLIIYIGLMNLKGV